MNRQRIIGLKRLTAWAAAIIMVLSLGLMAGRLTGVEPVDPIGSSSLQIPMEVGPEEGPSDYNQDGDTEDEAQTEPTEPTEPPETTQPTEPPETTQPTEPSQPRETEPEPTQQPTDPTQGTDPGTDPDPSNPEQGGDGDGPTQPGGDGDGEVEDDSLRIVTDLSDRVITFDELTDDTLNFYAYIVNGQPDMYLRVKIRNSQTSMNGTYLTASGRDYSTKLARQENNYLTLYLKQGDATVSEVTYVVRYVAKNASAEDPEVGDHPPTVTTNLDDFEGTMTNRNFTFIVTARDYEDGTIYSSNIIVTMDGKVVRNPTGSNVFEYALTFPDPVEGDFEDHVITVLVWDDQGNSTFRQFVVTYGFKDTGSEVGTAWIYVDATTVGLDPDTMGGGYAYTIKQGQPASYAVMEALEAMGYEVDYARTLDDGFFLQRIHRAGMCDYAEVPGNLWQKILDDGLALTGQRSADSLGDYDYTQGSGWMYSINGTLYAGKGLSEYYLSDGDALYLRFTLAYGKDIGGYVSSGGSYGRLSTYCGMWLYGTYYDLHQWGDVTVIQEPTCTEPGLQARTCDVCGDRDAQAQLPALGHQEIETGRQEPTADADGWVEYTCQLCGETRRETLPRPEPEPTEPDPTEPEPTEPEPTDPEPTDPEPTEPEPTDPEPTDPPEPDPTDPVTPPGRKEEEDEA